MRPGISGRRGAGRRRWRARSRRVDIITGTFGKTLGGGMGGFVAADQPVVDLLRQRARPYLFSNSLAPPVAAGALEAITLCREADDLRATLMGHTKAFRAGLTAAGFELLPGETPIIPVMLHEARRAQAMAEALDARGIYVAAFFFPSCPRARRASARSVGGAQWRRRAARHRGLRRCRAERRPDLRPGTPSLPRRAGA